MSVTALHWPGEESGLPDLGAGQLPALFRLRCVQCESSILVLVYRGPGGVEIIALPDTYGGISTPHTPPQVAFYLDQAQRSQSVGALSATIAMYRAALEQLLFEQGYTSGMLAGKIKALTEDVNPPAWVPQLDPEYLRVIKDLGNASIHPNDGDIEGQRAFNQALLAEVRELFVELLDDIYEQPKRKKQRLSALQTARDSFRKKP